MCFVSSLLRLHLQDLAWPNSQLRKYIPTQMRNGELHKTSQSWMQQQQHAQGVCHSHCQILPLYLEFPVPSIYSSAHLHAHFSSSIFYMADFYCYLNGTFDVGYAASPHKREVLQGLSCEWLPRLSWLRALGGPHLFTERKDAAVAKAVIFIACYLLPPPYLFIYSNNKLLIPMLGIILQVMQLD